MVCGVDEAGRGPLAGPVYAAAVILDRKRRINGLADSKVLTAEVRDGILTHTGDADLTLEEPITLTGDGFTLLSSFGSTTVAPGGTSVSLSTKIVVSPVISTFTGFFAFAGARLFRRCAEWMLDGADRDRLLDAMHVGLESRQEGGERLDREGGDDEGNP